MKILFENPPIIDAIRLAFPLSGNEIFAWGDIIYNPSKTTIPPWLIAHEEVHQRQQGEDVRGWWDRYLIDAEWRFTQELEAHQVEYRVFCVLNKDRNHRARYLNMISHRLSSKLYGNVITKYEAMKRIK